MVNSFSHDKDIESRILSHINRYGVSPLDLLKNPALLTRRTWSKRYLAHYELFKKTLELPGDIVEFGVFKGNGLLTFANFLEIFAIGDRLKRVIGFDNWCGFEKFHAKDGDLDANIEKTVGGYNAASYKLALTSSIEIFNVDRFVPWRERIIIIDGDITKSAPRFFTENPGVRVSLVNFDCDLYEPTIAALGAVWPKVVRGGILIFDEYGMPEWAGETAAVDEFFAAEKMALNKFSWSNVPGAYCIKT